MTEEKNASVKDGPVDKFKGVYIIFFWLGIGTLLPWNMFISVAAYWNHKFRTIETNATLETELPEKTTIYNDAEDDSTDDLSPGPNKLQNAWNGYLAVAAMVPNVTFLILNAVFGHKFKTQPRLIVSLIMVIISFTFTAIMVWVDTDSWQQEFMTLTLVSVAFINTNAAIFQGGILGVAGKFPPQYMGAVFGGQAVGGIFASGCNVVFLALGASAVMSGFFCFVTSVVFLLTSLVAYLFVTRSEFYQHYLGEKSQSEDQEKKPEDSKLLESKGDSPVSVPVTVNPLRVLLQISPYAAAVLICFLVTLGCFPAITVQAVSTMDKETAWAGTFFIPVGCFLLFNIGDYLGRFLAEMIQLPKPSKLGSWIVLGLSIARFAFLPLFLFCNVNPTQRNLTSVMFESDVAYIMIMLMFSVSSGYLATICMMSGPQMVRGEEAGTAASLLVAMLGIGLGTGAFLSNFFVKLL